MSHPGPRHRAALPRRRRVTRLAAVCALSLALVIGIGVTLVYQKLEGNLSALDTDAMLGGDRPDEMALDRPYKPLNILLIGSDSRLGTGIGGDTEGLSDTTILLHISGDRERAYGVSLPRDAMVERPECPTKDGEDVVPAPTELTMFNQSFAVGGPACTIKTVEHLTDIRINHFVEVNFTGFQDMVDALDGVPICVPEEVNDTYGKIYLEAGSYEADGRQALDYVRTRTGISNNGDIGRMRRQQAFLAAMTNKAVSAGTLANPVRLYNFLDAATKSIRLDEDLDSLARLAGLAKQLTDIGLENVQFLSVPFETWSEDANRLVWTDDADDLWEDIRADRPLGRALSEDVITAADAPTVRTPAAGGGESARGASGRSDEPTAADLERAARARENGLCA